MTTLTQCALEGYKYQAANYIIKPIRYVRLKAEMDQWCKRNPKNDSPAIVVVNDSGKYKIFCIRCDMWKRLTAICFCIRIRRILFVIRV